jgi:hypothetical protein
VLGLCLTAAPASAQTVTVADIYEWMPDREDRVRPTDINRADCVADATIEFKTTVRASSGTFQVWAGTGCTDAQTRSQATMCVMVAEADTTVESLTISVQDMLQTKMPGAGPTTGMATACDSTSGSSKGVDIRLFFMVINPSDNTALATAEKVFTYDIFLPPAPTGVKAAPGEESIELSFTPGEADDLKGYNFYCSPVGPPPAADGGAGPVASGDGTCTSSTLVPGADAPTESASACGNVRGSALSGGTAQGEGESRLLNDVEYAVAVAAVDDFGNVGKLSELACATPQEVTGFFEAYRAAGGQAGGGFCGFGPARRGSALAFVLLLGLAALRWRRR